MSYRKRDLRRNQKRAFSQMRDLLVRYVAGTVSTADFVPAYRALFAFFDPPENGLYLPRHERAELEAMVRVKGGWFGEFEDLIPKDPSWRYGVDTEPYGWIDTAGYRAWIRETLRSPNP
ncbi:MAG: hypothetical protein AB8I08_04495 [Sandaracinaceae bacterium]